MKKIVLGLIAVVYTGGLMAQNSRASIGFESALPLGDLGDAVGVGLGGTLGFETPIGKKAAFMFQAGYISFMGKAFDITDTATHKTTSFTTDPTWSVPIQVGLKYYFMENQHGFYAGVLAGIHLFSVKVPEVDPVTLAIVENTETDTYFSTAPELGYVLGSHFDVAVRYQMIFAQSETVNVDPMTYALSTESKNVINSYLGLRLAYVFGQSTGHPSHKLRL